VSRQQRFCHSNSLKLIQDRQNSSPRSKPLLYGNIIHELLQSALLTKQFDAKSLKASLDEVINRPGMQMDVWGADVGLEELREEVWEKVMLAVGGFGRKWVGPQPQVSKT
jgi:hypothetical protein